MLSSESFTVLGSLMLALALAVGLPGNLLVVWAVLSQGRGRGGRIRRPATSTSVLLLHLALADSFTLLTSPFWIHFLVSRDWVFGSVACKLAHYVCCLNMYASVFLISTMSVERLLAVIRPWFRRTRRRRWIRRAVLLGLWVLAALAAVPAAYYRDVVRGKLHCWRICEPDHPNPNHAAFHHLTETLLGFLLPLGLLSACYWVVGRRVRSLRHPGKSRAGRLMVAVVVAFTALWLPYHFVNVAQVTAELGGNKHFQGLMEEARPLVTSLAFLSCSVNPVLYAFCGARLLHSARYNLVARLFDAAAAVAAEEEEGGRSGARRDTGSGPEVGLSQTVGNTKESL
ncbi:leukotriene B4 receptor 2b [Hypanus sabinus]|uniref:leukotriene B4 receptor 2b n=1 Tax=Hypanus sabinus TaxID=79690 RepID=UPI0028C4D183|nr:leukotriene B4 receptor 2b [Hypanus sabinus]